MIIPVLLVTKESNTRPLPITAENKANHTAGLKETNNSADDSTRLDADGVEYMETKEAVDEGRTRNKTEEIMDKRRTINKTEELNLDVDSKVIIEDNGSGKKGESTISTARPKRVSTAGVTISTADPKMKLHKEVEKERQREEQASMDYIENLYDEVQEIIDADHELAVRLTHEEHEKYTVNKRVNLLAGYIKKRKKQRAEERAAAIRNKPPTRTQLKRLMMTYLKHTG
nr:hypothetical protein [Tanacetum cinerariifolium]